MKKTLTTALEVLTKLVKEELKMGSIATDKAVLHWDGEEDLKAGDAVYTIDEQGAQSPAADGDYLTEDQKTIIVADGKVAEIKDPEAEVAPQEAEEQKKEETVKAEEETPAEEEKPEDKGAELEKRVAELEALVQKMADWLGIVVMLYSEISKQPAAKSATETFRSEKRNEEKEDYLMQLAQAVRK